MRKRGIKILLFFCVSALIVIGVMLYNYSQAKKIPRNCSEYAVMFLEMGKKYYSVNSDSENWADAIDTETAIQNLCLKQYPKQYPWDK